MAKQRTPRPLGHKVQALDDHLFLVREHLAGLHENEAYLKALSTELRALLCFSSGTEGLLWRLVDEFGIDDRIHVHQTTTGPNPKHPRAHQLTMAYIPLKRARTGDPALPLQYESFKEIVKERMAFTVQGEAKTHEWLIKAISQQMGAAHEDDKIDQRLIDLMRLEVNGASSYVPVIATDAEFSLEIGDRVLREAESRLGYIRKIHNPDFGNLSIVVSIISGEPIAPGTVLFKTTSNIGDVEISALKSDSGIQFCMTRDSKTADIVAEYPGDFSPGSHVVVVFTYCSETGDGRTIVNGQQSEPIAMDEIGWVHAEDLTRLATSTRPTETADWYCLVFRSLIDSEFARTLPAQIPDHIVPEQMSNEQASEYPT